MSRSKHRFLNFVAAITWACLPGSLIVSAAAQPPAAAPDRARQKSDPGYSITAADADKEFAARLKTDIAAGKQRIEQFFDRPFKAAFVVQIFPGRAEFDKYLQNRWKMPKSQRWMVASGVADRLTIISPRVWKTEAAEHDPANAEHIRDLVAHELVHVYHGQYGPRPDFDDMDEMGWFIEGLAVHVSGQLERSHRHAAANALKAGKAPTRLADAWSGRYRYGVSGSMVEFIDKRFGRQILKKLLGSVSTGEALKTLNLGEKEFLELWIAHVRKSGE